MPTTIKPNKNTTRQHRTVEDVERRLWAVALYYASDYGFNPPCEKELKELIRKGAEKVETEGFLDNEKKLELAEKNVTSLISKMIVEAQQSNFPILYEVTKEKALIKLCPLWPIC